MRLKFYALMFFSLNTVLITTQSHAAETYTTCTSNEIKQIIQKHRLKLDTEFITDDSTKEFNAYACIKLPTQNQTVFAYTPASSQDEYGNQNHNLKMLLLDSKLAIQTHFLQKDFIEFSGLDYEGIRLENVPFSTLEDKTVIGLSRQENKHGDPGMSSHYLNLFQISSTGIFTKILNDFPTYYNTYLSRFGCDDASTDTLNRILILSEQRSHGLQNLIVKETKKTHGSELKTCKKSDEKHTRQHTMKFNGTQYLFNESNFLQSDGI